MSECFAVPFTEKPDENSVAIVTDHHKLMYSFHRRNNKKEVIVGWYATPTAKGELINDNTSLVHDFYAKECENPVHLVVNTVPSEDNVQVRGFFRKSVSVDGHTLAHMFQEVNVSTAFTDGEATCLSLVAKNLPKRPASSTTLKAALTDSTSTLHGSIDRLQEIVQQLQAYVDGVVEGKFPSNREVGVQIAQALHAFTHQPLSVEQFAALQTRYQDLLMVAYLASLAQTQAVVAEKLNQIL